MHSEEFAPRPRFFEESDYRALRSQLAFNLFYQFYIGIYTGEQEALIQEDHFGVSLVEGDNLVLLSDAVRAYSLTLMIKNLVLQVFCAKNIDSGVPIRMRSFEGFSIPITGSAAVGWPPSKAGGITEARAVVPPFISNGLGL